MLSPVEEIKARIDIAELIQSYVRLQKAGANFKANCPFHQEKTPSFYVTPSRQIWYCFGCGKGGDIFGFIMEIEGQDFPEALRMLADRAGVMLKREDPSIRSERNRLYDVCEMASKVFEYTLGEVPTVKEYLRNRGVSDETVKEFRIGYAPDRWDYLVTVMMKKGFTREELEKAGLVSRSEDRSSWYDRFRSRIMFPIPDANGRIVGFGGRIFEPGLKQKNPDRVEAKYINSPQTPIYDKSHVLYGFEKAKQEIRTAGRAVIVEGYMDCIMSHQAGVKNTVAVSGTALTPHQLTMLKRLCDTVVCSFDTDAAGDSATKRSLGLASEFGFERLVIRIPSGKDPADTVAEDSKAWEKAVEEAKPVIPFYFDKAFRTYDPRIPEQMRSITAMLLPLINDVADEIEKARWISNLSAKIGVSEEFIRKEMTRRGSAADAAEPRFQQPTQAAPVKAPKSRRERLEEQFLQVLSMLEPEVRKAEATEYQIEFGTPQHQTLFALLTQSPSSNASDAETFDHVIKTLQFKGELLLGQLHTDPRQELVLCRKELEKEWLKERLSALTREIEVNERSGNADRLTPLLQDFRAISDRLKFLL